MNFSGKEGHPNIQPSTRPRIEPGTSGLGGRDLNHCAKPLRFPFTLFFFFPYLFRFNFVVSERNVHILFCRHIWAELSLLFWTFLSGTFFPGGGGGGGCTCTQCTRPLRTRLSYTKYLFYMSTKRHVTNVNISY